PFEGTMGMVLSSIVTEDPPPPSAHRPGVDPRLEAIVHKAMARKISERYSSMAELSKALERLLAEGNVPDEGAGSGTQNIMASQRQRGLVSQTALTETPVTMPPPKDWAAPKAQAPGARRLVLATLLVMGLSAAAAGVVVVLNRTEVHPPAST